MMMLLSDREGRFLSHSEPAANRRANGQPSEKFHQSRAVRSLSEWTKDRSSNNGGMRFAVFFYAKATSRKILFRKQPRCSLAQCRTAFLSEPDIYLFTFNRRWLQQAHSLSKQWVPFWERKQIDGGIVEEDLCRRRSELIQDAQILYCD